MGTGTTKDSHNRDVEKNESAAAYFATPDVPYTAEELNLAEHLFRSFGLMSRGPMQQIQGATRGEMALLGFLESTDHPLAPSDLAERLKLTSARIANTLNSLERKGLIERSHDETDRRRVEVSITPAGSELFRTQLKGAVLGLTAMVRDLGMDDAREFVRITSRIEGLISEREQVYPPPLIDFGDIA
ncbi:MAG: MarR family transcriptional regulator [Atopobiaceae bacterium]|jgi:DNA-binding MarR family transcriptional regulator|nr:MarR family transcriptional regulator [Atopobiaceae bacterium]MCH4181330.1 MarR family transcriptional regulator [Atopobiaceae bacterium]MCH4213515.1 MarR family transcriptional regulator [Atopobiaceae bacterium]MCH4276162.1 MarR family transcriptional regulator [Atopobiaceae bacterium]MCI1227172.1 MarR family transcriptional regulator [Atopobiaceae bacterium]